jgi:N-acyl-D-aspartate/D-glutamate deacylase
MAELDLVISGGRVVDGTGAPARTADVGIAEGRVVEVGRVDTGAAARRIDADGAVVTPGFVDVHAHYDGQATWDNHLWPSSWHGVTTVVMGNCGVGFAPVRPGDHDRLIELMEGVEDIPGTALHEGLTWEWESFPSYLDHLDRRRFDMDVGAQVPHGAVRLFAMGDRGAAREDATADDIAAMAELVAQGVAAGALGFTTSRTTNHKTSKGEPTPTLTAAAEELVGIAAAMASTGGVLQVVSDFTELETEFAILRSMAEVSGRPLAISLANEPHRAPWRAVRDLIADARSRGLEVRGQVAAKAIGVVLGFDTSVHPFRGLPPYREVADLPLAERAAALSEPGRRARLLEEAQPDRGLVGLLDRVFPLEDPPRYEPAADESVAAMARRRGCSAAEVALDLMLAGGGTGLLYYPLFNWNDGLDDTREMLSDPMLIPGLADGGAHVGTICDAANTTFLLTHWARDRAEGLELEWLVQRQCRATAESVGLLDRGVLAPGMRADINVIDLDSLTLRRPFIAHDLPAGGRRLLQKADGYRHTFVAGVETYADGEPTGALPGRLVRGAQPAAHPSA